MVSVVKPVHNLTGSEKALVGHVSRKLNDAGSSCGEAAADATYRGAPAWAPISWLPCGLTQMPSP